jgi:hypothetical protein
MRTTKTVAAAVALALAIGAQQPNTAAASMTLAGIDGPAWPIILPINVATWNPDLTIEISGPPLRPFLLAAAPAGVLGSGIPTQFGILDLNLAAGYSILLDGTAPMPAGMLATTNSAGQWSLSVPLHAGTAGISTGLQCLMSVPAAPSGFVFTAATFLSTVNVPTSAVFVSHSRGAAGNPGTAGSPFLTLQQGIAAALAAGAPYPVVYVEHGSYTPTGPVALTGGMNILGGLDAVSWTPVAGAYSTVNVGSDGISASAIASPTTISRLEVVAANATLPSAPDSIALRALTCSSSLAFVSCRFQAGNGAPGLIGAAPAAAADGGDGSGNNGGNGHPHDGGDGGNAGSPGGNGGSGAAGQGTGGGAGGGGSAGAPCGGTNNGGHGDPGANGSHGAGGTPVAAGGAVINDGTFSEFTGGAGAAGAPGRGGGGGGGSGGNFCTNTSGRNGGGGGGGGAGGNGGGPGSSGGSSIAVTLFDSSPLFQDCVFATSTGGPGGQGGNAGSGGSGGSYANGGSAGTFVGAGGHGGNGGNGGKGGGGAGGNGGCSLGVAKTFASSPTFAGSSTFNIGAAGPGGPGGIVPSGAGNPGQAGNAGLAGNVY